MGWMTSIAVFFVIWWVILFVTLPLGVRGQWETDHIEEGTEPGAPTKPQLGKKMLLTTGLAIVIFSAFRIALHFGVLDFMTRS